MKGLIVGKFFYVFLLLMPCSFVFAQPEIDSISGTVSAGQNLILSGNGFGIKSKASPVKFENFENGSNGAPLYSTDDSWLVYDCADMGTPGPHCDHQGALFQNAYSHSGNLSVGRHISNGESFNTNHFTYSPASSEMFISYWWRTANADTNDDTIIKMSRINSSEAAGGGGVYYGVGGTNLGGNYNLANGADPYCAFNNGVTNEMFNNNGTVGYITAPPMNKWVRVDMYKKLSTPGITDGKISVEMRSPTFASSAFNNSALTRAAGRSFLLDTVLLGLEDGSENAHDYDIFIDDMYIDTTQARVELCIGSTWLTRGVCEIQPQVSWNNNAIGITFNKGAFSDGGTGYLYVVDEDGLVNSSGSQVTIGLESIGDTVPAAPPTDLNVD